MNAELRQKLRRLTYVKGRDGDLCCQLRNPDGPEAEAYITKLEARIALLEGGGNYDRMAYLEARRASLEETVRVFRSALEDIAEGRGMLGVNVGTDLIWAMERALAALTQEAHK